MTISCQCTTGPIVSCVRHTKAADNRFFSLPSISIHFTVAAGSTFTCYIPGILTPATATNTKVYLKQVNWNSVMLYHVANLGMAAFYYSENTVNYAAAYTSTGTSTLTHTISARKYIILMQYSFFT